MLNDILRQIEKLQEKYEGAKEVSEKLITIVDSLLDMFKMNYDPKCLRHYTHLFGQMDLNLQFDQLFFG